MQTRVLFQISVSGGCDSNLMRKAKKKKELVSFPVVACLLCFLFASILLFCKYWTSFFLLIQSKQVGSRGMMDKEEEIGLTSDVQ